MSSKTVAIITTNANIGINLFESPVFTYIELVAITINNDSNTSWILLRLIFNFISPYSELYF